MKLTLLNRDGSRAGVLEWDEEAGSLSGALADEALSLIGMVVDTGFVSVQPGSFRISVKDPLRDRREMAAVLDKRWQVPELSEFYPDVPDSGELLDGAVY